MTAALRMMVLAAASLLGSGANAQVEVRRNWFNDPFIQLSRARTPCTEPRGPMLTWAEQREQAHHRIERGTTCWLMGRCFESNAYRYDHRIARDLVARWRAEPTLADSSLWITVQGRVVYFEGCVASPRDVRRLEAFAMQSVHVQQAVALVHWPGRAGQAYTPKD